MVSAYHVGDDCGRDSQILHPYKSYLYILLDSESGFSKKKRITHPRDTVSFLWLWGFSGETPPFCYGFTIMMNKNHEKIHG